MDTDISIVITEGKGEEQVENYIGVQMVTGD